MTAGATALDIATVHPAHSYLRADVNGNEEDNGPDSHALLSCVTCPAARPSFRHLKQSFCSSQNPISPYEPTSRTRAQNVQVPYTLYLSQPQTLDPVEAAHLPEPTPSMRAQDWKCLIPCTRLHLRP